MRSHARVAFFIAILALTAGVARADVIVRVDESTLKGSFKGGTDAAVMFESGGKVQQLNFSDIACLVFAGRSAGTAAKASATASGSGPSTLIRVDGTVLKGTFKGGTGDGVIFESGGKEQQINLADIALIMNTRPAAPAAATSTTTTAPAAAAAPAAAPVVASSVVPAGTKLLVGLTQDVTTASHAAGAMVEGALAAPLTVGGNVFAPEGTKVWGKVSESRGGKVVGGSYIMFSFTEIQIGNDRLPIVTSAVGAEAGKGGTAKKVGAGALIGGAAGDAGAGAAVGGAVALLSSRNNHLQIPKGTKAEVALSQDLKIGN